jgi:xanthine dehydrogenase accessory factor
MDDVYREIVRIRESGGRAALATIIATRGSSPGKQAMKLLVLEDGRTVGTVGGGCVEADVHDAALLAIRDETPRLLEFSLTERGLPGGGLMCGGTVSVFIEPIVTPTLLIFGAGHVSLGLSRVAALAGFRVVVLDDRETFARSERFPDAAEVHAIADFGVAMEHVSIGQDTYGVIVTRGHQHDELVLRQLLGRPLVYLGLIGSRTKIVKLFQELEESGVPRAHLDRVHAPIGLDIGAETPEEIAVAIVAEMIARRRQGVDEGHDPAQRRRRPSLSRVRGGKESKKSKEPAGPARKGRSPGETSAGTPGSRA